MFISRLIIIWIILLDSFHIVFVHDIEEKLFTNSRFNRSSEDLMNVETVVGTPRQSTLGGFSYLAVSLLFQLPLMEIVFVMGLLILVLGIMLHFVELKADFFRLRRQFFREEKLRLQKQREEELRNRTLAMQMSNSSQNNFGNGQLSENYPYYGDQHRDNIYGQYSHNSYPTYRIPPFHYRQPNRFPPLRPDHFRPLLMNYPNFYRPRFPQRYPVPNHRLPGIRRQGHQHYSQIRGK